MAEECRVLAASAKTPEIREQLRDLAEQFDRLARHRESIEMINVGVRHLEHKSDQWSSKPASTCREANEESSVVR
jgi:uncharacterized protein Yka (UPF0111/DUF47 family)